MQMDIVEYHQTEMFKGIVIKYKCETYLCTGCGSKIDTMNTMQYNMTSAKLEYLRMLKEYLNEDNNRN
jgi:hypothetical protein